MQSKNAQTSSTTLAAVEVLDGGGGDGDDGTRAGGVDLSL
ncbi:unnamed protein product, partial [Nippostrongylus brasiliensis]|uniref:Uncharacterized protein n=1 Tax=Nippostrongylus brasiliensis TaxID=27835 RepID=A0A0N4YXX0_NIPBR